MEQFFQWLQAIDRRIIYLAVGLILILGLTLGKRETGIVQPAAEDMFSVIDKAPAGPEDGKIILVGMTFASNTLPENGNQAQALIRHLMLRKKRFAIISISEPQGARNSRLLVKELAKQYGYEYGKDWINFGYQIGVLAFYKSFPKDIPGTVRVDAEYKKPLSSYEIMRGINSIKDIAAHVEITASASAGDWIALVQPTTTPRLKIGYACTGVMAAEASPLLDSGQLFGAMLGLKGAADYEQKVDELEAQIIRDGSYTLPDGQPLKPFDPKQVKSIAVPGPARVLMFTQSWAHILIIVFIMLGNIGMLLGRRQAKRGDKKEAA